MSKEGTAGKMNHVTLMVPQKLIIIRRLENGGSLFVVASHDIGLSIIYDVKKWKYQLRSFMASSESVKDLFK
jgi:hypothetical protein